MFSRPTEFWIELYYLFLWRRHCASIEPISNISIERHLLNQRRRAQLAEGLNCSAPLFSSLSATSHEFTFASTRTALLLS